MECFNAADSDFIAEFTKIRNDELLLLDNCIPDKIPALGEDGDCLVDEKEHFIYKNNDLLINLQDVDDKISKLPAHFRGNLIREQMSNPEFNFTLDYRDIRDYEDVLSIDHIFIPLNGREHRELIIRDTIDIKYDVKCIVNYNISRIGPVEFRDYIGNVWTFTHPLYPQYCGMYGLKGAILESLVTYYRRIGIVKELLLGVIKYAKIMKCTTLIVPWPLERMAKILTRYGFTEYNNFDENIEQRRFMWNITSTSNWFQCDINKIKF